MALANFSLSAIVGALLVLWIVTVISRWISNVFFSPLSKLPGPLLARASRLYFVYYRLQGTLPFQIKKLHDQYGPVVRIAPDEVSYNSYEAWQDIYGHRSGAKTSSFGKDPQFYGNPVESKDRVSSIIDANDDDHRRMRRLQSHAFSEKALSSQEPVLIKYVDLFIQKLHEKASDATEGGVVDLVHWFNFTTFDLIGDLAFGKPFGCLETGKTHFWMDNFFGTLRVGNVLTSLRYLNPPVFNFIMKTLAKGMPEEKIRQFRFAQDTAKERINAGVMRADGREDFMSYILRANDEKGMSYKEMEEAANLYIIAGSETTATLLSGLTYHLLRNPSVYSKLTKEIREAFKTEEELKISALSRLPYLHAVFEESLRIYPPAPSLLPRAVPAGGATVCEEYIPEGTALGISAWVTHHSAANFKRPDEFIPERWLDDEEFKDDNKKAFQPFSFGPRNCIGRNLAYSEMRLILGRLLWNFDLELLLESVGWQESQQIIFMWEKGPLKVKLNPRSHV